jgi:hypothetical protein
LQISLEFICAFPTPQAAAELTFEQFKAFAKSHHHPQPSKLAACFARLQKPQPEARQQTVLAFQSEAVRLARLSLQAVQDKTATIRETQELFEEHPDYPIFSSLPGVGKILAPALLAKFGDDRLRFPTPQVLQSVAGTCPVTRASGKHKVSFSATPVIMSSVGLCNNGRNVRSTLRFGPILTSNPFAPTVTRSAMPIGVWPIAGSRLPGGFGKTGPLTMKSVICANMLYE